MTARTGKTGYSEIDLSEWEGHSKDGQIDELAQAEHRFRAIVEASPMPLLLSRLEDGIILYANDRLEAILDVPPGSLVGQKTPDFYFDPADRARVIETVQQQGSVRDLELRIKRPDGESRWVSLSVQQLDFDGAPALATALIDITERKRTEKALRASEESYRGLFDALTEMVYIQDLEGHFLSVNEAVERAYGYTREEIIGQTPALLADPERVDIEGTMKHFRRAVAGTPQRFDWWGRRKDGSTFPKEVVLKRSTHFGQDVVIGVARDISDRVEAEAALRRSEEYFRRLIEHASDLISIMDTKGIIRYQSPAVMRMLGYEPGELTGKNAFDYLAPEDVAPTQKRWQRALEDPDIPVSAEFRFRHKDGSWRFIEAVGSTLSSDAGVEGVVVNSRDITERKRAEATLRLQKTLLEAQGEASIDGILVVSDEGKILSYNQRFVEMWSLPPEVVASQSDEDAIQAVLSQLQHPEEFLERIEHLYAHPEEKARDEIALRDGRVFDRYSAPVISNEGDYYGRIWFFRDMTSQKQYAEELEQARREAERAQQRADHYAKSLERELEFGRQIQQSFLPAGLPHPPGWEIAARFCPAWQVAGDFYEAFELPGGRIGFFIGDVSGKGVGAALFMALYQSLLRAFAERANAATAETPSSDEAALAEAITGVNAYITRVHRQAHMFASVFFGLLNPASGTMHYINAGHEPPTVIGLDGARVLLYPTGPALGLLADASFEVASTVLKHGELFLAFTDGVTEARNLEGHFFGRERLLALLENPAPTATRLLDRIEQTVRTFCGEAPPYDDLTLLAIRHDAD